MNKAFQCRPWAVPFLVAIMVAPLRAEDFACYKTPPIKIDGVLDEPAWQQATSIPIKFVNGKKDVVAKDVTGEFMLAWDDRYLYVAYRYASSNAPVSYWNGDMTGDGMKRLALGAPAGEPRSHIFELNVNLNFDGRYVWELHHSAQNYWLCKLALRPRDTGDPLWNIIGNPSNPPVLFIPFGLQFNAGYGLKTAVCEQRIKVNGAEHYAGYVTEWAVPLRGLGPPLDRRDKDGKYRLEGLRFCAFGGEWRMDGSEAANYHSVPGSDKIWYADTLLVGHVFVFQEMKRRDEWPGAR